MHERVDLSVLFALSDLSKKIKSQSYNLLILDEVEHGLDKEGMTLLVDILKEKAEEMEIIVIAHKVDIDDNNLNRTVPVEMVNGFTEMSFGS